jgi:hypothetical protein
VTWSWLTVNAKAIAHLNQMVVVWYASTCTWL